VPAAPPAPAAAAAQAPDPALLLHVCGTPRLEGLSVVAGELRKSGVAKVYVRSGMAIKGKTRPRFLVVFGPLEDASPGLREQANELNVPVLLESALLATLASSGLQPTEKLRGLLAPAPAPAPRRASRGGGAAGSDGGAETLGMFQLLNLHVYGAALVRQRKVEGDTWHRIKDALAAAHVKVCGVPPRRGTDTHRSPLYLAEHTNDILEEVNELLRELRG